MKLLTIKFIKSATLILKRRAKKYGPWNWRIKIIDRQEPQLTDIEIAADMLAIIMSFIGTGRTVEDRGFRFNVVWHELRPGETGFTNLKHLSECSGKGFNRANVHKISKEFRDITKSRSLSQRRNKSASKKP